MTTIASQFVGNLARELCELLVACFLGPGIAGYMTTKFICWLIELGFSTLTAYCLGRKLDSSAYDEDKFWLKH